MQGTDLLAWILVGLVAGYLASRVIPSPFGLLGDTLAGMAGAFVGTWLFRELGGQGTTGLSVWSILVSFVGAVVLLIIIRVVMNIASRA